MRLPYWQETLALSKRLVAAFPQQRFVGIDMAIGERGPVVVELNPVPDFTGYRVFKGHPADLLAP